ncbi:MAG: hypothetical protein CL758_02265 [Chloroflexi bacterium]|nr:hypothetical protein [Chloroflexota bacterium]|tara:strand:- start:851 stop:1216 length:366 start_codon:yes stop_codon:yes gene_type:complete
MSQTDVSISKYAEDLVNIPRAHLALELQQDQNSVKLLHNEELLIECPITLNGMTAATFMAEALGITVPPLNKSIKSRVSTGVLFRVMAISNLDYSIKESFIILERLLTEAKEQIGGSSDLT